MNLYGVFYDKTPYSLYRPPALKMKQRHTFLANIAGKIFKISCGQEVDIIQAFDLYN
jgi:hypothetical protein